MPIGKYVSPAAKAKLCSLGVKSMKFGMVALSGMVYQFGYRPTLVYCLGYLLFKMASNMADNNNNT